MDNAEGELNMSASLPSPSLETLPAELRDKILLHLPDLPTLRALIHASPVMHAQYRENRDSILRACLGRELDGFFIDAHACLMSRAPLLGPVRTNQGIKAFLVDYGAMLTNEQPRPAIAAVSSSDLQWLAKFHTSVVQPMARHYCRWALENLSNAASSLPSDEAEDPVTAGDGQDFILSRSEEIRVFRALYRCETYCHLFGRHDPWGDDDRRGGFRHHQVNGIFFCLFDPWEAEAVGCIEVFLRHRYVDIFDEVKEDFRCEDYKAVTPCGESNPEGSYDLDIEYDVYLDGTLSRGLAVAAHLFTITDHTELAQTLEGYLTRRIELDPPMQDALCEVAQDDRRELTNSLPAKPRDEADERRDPMEFTGDAVPPDGPPLGWVLLWRDVYANIYGGYIPEAVQQWGYVMWDESRWTEIGAEDLVAKQWDATPELVKVIEVDREQWAELRRLGLLPVRHNSNHSSDS